MGISVNGPSGIDTQYIIDSLVSLEQNKVTKVQNQKKAYQLKIDGFGKFKTLLTDLQTKVKNLAKTSSFDIFKTTSSNEKLVSVTAGAGSVNANYDLKVFQLASNEKMISGDKLVTNQDESLSSLGIGVGTISINGTEIVIDDTDTLQDLRQKINSATDANGTRLEISASVLKIADDNFRLVLTSKKSGSEGVTYEDVSGSTLQDLGIITAATGDNKGTTNQALTSATEMQLLWENLAEGDSIAFTAKDRNGKEFSANIIKHAASTPEESAADLLSAVNGAFSGLVESSFDGSGNLVVTDRVGGNSLLAISDMTVQTTSGDTPVTFDTSYGDTGSGVLSVGRDSFFSVENIFMSNSSNTATGFVNGVTFNFNGVSTDENVSVSLERDGEGIRKKFQEMIDAYNALLRFSKSNTKVADPTDENASSGALAGDSTVRSVVSQMNNFFHQQFNELNSTYTSFNMVGLKTDTANGELTVDSAMFDKALTEKYDEVVNLFVTVGTSDNNGVVLGTSTKDTKSGNYVFEEVDDNRFQARLATGSTWYTSESRTGEIVSWEDGPLKGLSITAPTGVIGTGNSATFTMSKGLSAIIDEAITSMSDPHDGLIAMRTESYTRSMSRTDDKISQLEERIEKYRIRLVNQFSAMEQALSKLQSQSTNMLSQLGQTSSS